MSELTRRTFLRSGAAAGLALLASDLLPGPAPAAWAAGPAGSPPSLDAMAGDWQPVSGIVHQPETSNFWGGLEVDGNICGFQRLAAAPYTQGGSGFDMTFDGAALASEFVRWYPYQIHRLAETAKGLWVLSGTRMAFEANQVLITLGITNPTGNQVSTTVSVALDPVIRKYTSGWTWQIPRPSDQNFSAQLVGAAPNQNLLVADKTGPAVTAVALSPAPQSLSVSGIGGTATWTLTLPAGSATRFGNYSAFLTMLTTFSGVTSQGPFGQAHQLEPGRFGYRVVDSPELNPGTAITLAAWIDATAWPAQIWQGSIIAKDSFSANAGYVFRGGAGGLLSFVLYIGGGNWSELQATTPLSAGWHHVAATYDGSTMSIYVDGARQAAKSQSGSVFPSTGLAAMVGSCPSDMTRQFVGSIADARIYSRALSSTEVAAIHSAGNTFAARSDPAMQLWYQRVSGPLTAPPDAGLIANDNPQVYNGTEGGAFAGVIITDLFGYAPDGQQTALKDAGIARGFDGTLSGLSFDGQSYAITSGSGGLSIG